MGQIGVDLVFVVGASRSGTTMLSRILGHNEKLFGLQELHYFGDIWDPNKSDSVVPPTKAVEIAAVLFARQRKDIWGGVPETEDYAAAKNLFSDGKPVTYSSLFQRFITGLALQHGKTTAVEQTPRNIYYINRLLEIYPSCRVVEVVRDPRAVLYSQRQRWKMRSLGAKNVPIKEVIRVWFNYHATTMSMLWLKAVTAGFVAEGNPRVKRVRYEDIVNNPKHTVQYICDFLGISYTEKMLAIPRIASSTATNNKQHKGISQDSANAWNLGLPLGDRIICGHLTWRAAQRLGYDIPDASIFHYRAGLHFMRYPLHVVGIFLANPKRALIQIKGILSGR
jgi:hypothetical protein